jgi:Flp pilus assembly protein TadG
MRLPSHRSRCLRCLARCQRGVTAIEFAIIAPVLLLLLLGILEFSLIMLVSNIMESATSLSARLGKTGYTESGKSRQDTILDEIHNRAGVLIDPTQLTVTSKYYKQFDQINDAEPWNDTNHNGTPDPGEWTDINGNGTYDTDMAQAGYGNADDIVVYTVSYPWKIVTPIVSELVGHNGTYTITTHAVVKNEPY